MSTIKTNQIQTTAGKPILNSTGSILQVIQVVPSPTIVTSNSNTYDTLNPTTANTALLFSGTITPSNASNKILVKLNGYFDASTALNGETVCLFRSSTFLFASYWYRRVSGNETQPHLITYLDSPSSTNAVQYDIRVSTGGGWNISVNRSNSNSTGAYWSKLTSLTLMEVSG